MGALIIGIVLLAAGGLARFWVGRRKFHRRNAAGLEEFQSYGGALATQGLERLASIAGVVLILFGLMLIATFFFRPN